MISTKVAGIASGALLIYVHAKICKKQIETSVLLRDQITVENWLNLKYRNILADAVLRFLKQRKQALRHFRRPDLQAESALAVLFARFENAQQLSLYELANRIIISEKLFQRIMPPAGSRFYSWNETLYSAASICSSILKLRESHPDRRLSLSEFINI